MRRTSLLGMVTALAFLTQAAIGEAQVRDAGDAAAESAAKQALEVFITQWNTADNANLRRAMNFPFVTVPGGGALLLNSRPEDFSEGFDQMRAREGWERSSFDFDSYKVIKSSPNKVHAEIGFSRYRADGTAYRTSRVFYVLTKRDDHWGVQLRTSAASPADLGAEERAEIVDAARQAVLDFFTAFIHKRRGRRGGGVEPPSCLHDTGRRLLGGRGRWGWAAAEFRPDAAARELAHEHHRCAGREPRHAQQGALRVDVLTLAPGRQAVLDGSRALDRDQGGRPLGNSGTLAHGTDVGYEGELG